MKCLRRKARFLKQSIGQPVGTPVSVERCVKDLVLVDAALNDSALSPEIQTTGQDIGNTLDDLETPGVQDTSETDILHTSEALDILEALSAEISDKGETISKDDSGKEIPDPETSEQAGPESHSDPGPRLNSQTESNDSASTEQCEVIPEDKGKTRTDTRSGSRWRK